MLTHTELRNKVSQYPRTAWGSSIHPSWGLQPWAGGQGWPGLSWVHSNGRVESALSSVSVCVFHSALPLCYTSVFKPPRQNTWACPCRRAVIPSSSTVYFHILPPKFLWSYTKSSSSSANTDKNTHFVHRQSSSPGSLCFAGDSWKLEDTLKNSRVKEEVVKQGIQRATVIFTS